MAKVLDVEKGLSALGRWSRWHIIMYCLATSTCVFAALHMLAIIFVGLKPTTHHCEVPDGVSYSEGIPADKDGSGALAKCSHYANFSSATNVTVEGCPLGWHYSDEVYTIIHEWDTVCDQEYLVNTAQTVLVLGVLVGAITASSLSDYVGRKRVFIGSVLGASAMGFCLTWVHHYWLFCLIRFFIGIFQQGIMLTSFVYCCELFPMADRTAAGLLTMVGWSLGCALLVFFGYFLRDWHYLMLGMSVPGLLVIPLFWILPESVPYLAAKGRLREAKEILNSAARINGVRLPKEFLLSAEDERLLSIDATVDAALMRRRSSVVQAVQGARRSSVVMAARRSSVGIGDRRLSRALEPDGEIYNYTVKDLFKSCRMLSYTLVMAFLWCTSALVFYGFTLNAGSLAGDVYVNNLLSSLIEIPASLLCLVLLQMVGRRWPLAIFHIIAGVPCFITIFIPETTSDGTNLKPLIVTLAMIGKFGITGCFSAVFMFAPELLPTTVRGTGIGIASMGARVGSLISPFTNLVAAAVPWLPSAVFGAMCALGTGMCLYLPETLGRPLPQTIKQVEAWSRTLTPEEKAKFEAIKRADSERRKRLEEESKSPSHELPAIYE